MVVPRESSVPRTSKVQSDDVALYKSLLERSKVVQEGILLGNLGILTVCRCWHNTSKLQSDDVAFCISLI